MTDNQKPSPVSDLGSLIERGAQSLGDFVRIATGATPGSLDDARTAYEKYLIESFPAPAGVDFTDVTAAGVPSQWLTPAETLDGRTLLYFHGGAYQVGSPAGYHGLVGRYAQQLRCRALVPNYRLAPEHRYPAAVDDCLAAYRWLLEQGTDPSSIVFSGDSGGGALTVSILVAARDQGLPLPAVGVAFSPWANLEHTGDSWITKRDPLVSKDGADLAAGIYLGSAPAHSPLASPVFADVQGLPPILIQIGEQEGMLSDAVRLADHLAQAAVRVRLDVFPGMPHVWHHFTDRLAEAREAISDAVAFAERYLITGGRTDLDYRHDYC